MLKNMRFEWDSSKYISASGLQTAMGKRLIDTLPIRNNENILDIGCGTGNLTLKMAGIVNNGYVTGIDSSPLMIKKAKEMAESILVKNIRFLVMDAGDINFNRQFDMVFSNSAIHWIKESEKLLKSIKAALKQRGHIGLQFPLLNSSHPLISIASKVIESLKLEDYYNSWDFPWFVPALEEYEALLSNLGFKDINIQQIENTFKFRSAAAALDFLDSVGLVLFSEPLPSERKILFREEFMKTLKELTSKNGLEFTFQRLFVFANADEKAIGK
ncbi:trans-aconitate 2-methyltransferase [archaeon]|nr:trans-aconitate 2-methyltransferase [archaeon]